MIETERRRKEGKKGTKNKTHMYTGPFQEDALLYSSKESAMLCLLGTDPGQSVKQW